MCCFKKQEYNRKFCILGEIGDYRDKNIEPSIVWGHNKYHGPVTSIWHQICCYLDPELSFQTVKYNSYYLQTKKETQMIPKVL